MKGRAMPQKPKKSKRRGPEPKTLRGEGDWRDAVRKALKKERPPEGWPTPKRKGKGK